MYGCACVLPMQVGVSFAGLPLRTQEELEAMKSMPELGHVSAEDFESYSVVGTSAGSSRGTAPSGSLTGALGARVPPATSPPLLSPWLQKPDASARRFRPTP